MRISDWSSDVCSSDLIQVDGQLVAIPRHQVGVRRHRKRGTGKRDFQSDRERNRKKQQQPSERDHDHRPPCPWQPATEGPVHEVSTTPARSEEHTSELQSLMRISYAVFCLKKKKHNQ